MISRPLCGLFEVISSAFVDNALWWSMKSSRALRNGAATVLVMTRGGTRGFSSLRNTGCLQRSIRGMDVGGRYMALVSGSRSSQSALHREWFCHGWPVTLANAIL